MARQRKSLPDTTPPYDEPDRDDPACEHPVTSTLSRDLVERAAKFIVTQPEECEGELLWPLPEEGCEIARQLRLGGRHRAGDRGNARQDRAYRHHLTSTGASVQGYVRGPLCAGDAQQRPGRRRQRTSVAAGQPDIVGLAGLELAPSSLSGTFAGCVLAG
jgi:hypothetical protein